MENNPYTHITVYTRDSHLSMWNHITFSGKDKEPALEVIRGMKSTLRVEPRLNFVENENADVLHVKFGNTGYEGRIIFMKKALEEIVNCPSCSMLLKRGEDNTSSCHGWNCNWELDVVGQVWRVNTITKEGL